MKKLINSPDRFVQDQLEGFLSAHRDMIDISFDPTFVHRKKAPAGPKVGLISGGGSGHEPLHIGYVGSGMLDAACPGEIFTSPTPDQIEAAGKHVDTGKGLLFIAKNYTGDVMNFQMAADLLIDQGIDIRQVVIDDDVAVKDSLYTAGRRGLGTTIVAEKICGAAAEAGMELDDLANLCRKINLRGKSLGIALTSCIHPSGGQPSFTIGEEEMELGIGIHGEPGVERMPMKSADEITQILFDTIVEDGAFTRTQQEWNPKNKEWEDVEYVDEVFSKGDRVIAIINGMGGTPNGELYSVYRKLDELADDFGLHIARKRIGSFITSMEMKGVSLTLVKADDEMLKWWDAPAKTPVFECSNP